MIGKRLSIRTRLTIWYSLLFAAAQITIGVAAWGMLHQSLGSVVRETLQSRIEGVRRFLNKQNPGISDSELRAETTQEYESEQDGDWLQIRNDHGEWLYRSSLMSGNRISHLDQPAGHLRKASISGQSYVFFTASINVHGRTYNVEAGIDTSEFHATVAHFKISALLLAPFALLLAALGGYWLSGRALAPVDAITRAARSIGADNLSQRLAPLETRDELQRLSETLNGMLDRIEAGFRRITEFTADASHELRTPLALMRTEVEVTLRKPRTQEDYETALRGILSECNRTAALVDGLLALARSDAGVDDLKKSRLTLGAFLQEVAAEWKSTIAARNLKLEVTLPAEELGVEGDPVALRRLIDILVDNAVRYTPSPGTITISLQQKDGNASVSVRDTGIGIAAEDLPRIFERFYRSDKARTREQGGVGLGLSLAQSIAQKHGGKLEVTSKTGHGSTFEILLPLSV